MNDEYRRTLGGYVLERHVPWTIQEREMIQSGWKPLWSYSLQGKFFRNWIILAPPKKHTTASKLIMKNTKLSFNDLTEDQKQALDGLTQEQTDAVLEKNVLLKATAGSGKTRCLATRVEFLKLRGYDPTEILCITFTNKAAYEMRHRINDKLVNIGTLHSLVLSIAKANPQAFGLEHGFTVTDKEMSWARAKAENTLPYNQFFSKYLQTNLKNELRANFKHILVDECQDLNKDQIEFLKCFHPITWFFVGDENQSIYEFRGAAGSFDVLQKEFRLRLMHLSENFRCHERIESFSRRIDTGFEIKSFTSKKGGYLVKKELKSCTEEARFIVSEIQKAVNFKQKTTSEFWKNPFLEVEREALLSKISYSDIAILVRQSSLTGPLQAELLKAKIPFRVFGDLSFKDRIPYKNLVAFATLKKNPAAFTELEYLVKNTSMGIGVATMKKAKESYRKEGKVNALQFLIDKIADDRKAYEQQKADFESGKIKKMTKKEPRAVFDQAFEVGKDLKSLEYFGVIKHLAGKSETDYEQLRKFCRDFKDTDQFLEWHLESKEEEEQRNCVTISTIHRAKGLEWDVVFVLGCEEPYLPSDRSDNQEEEGRIFYVAVTRARKVLYLTAANYRMMFGTLQPSGSKTFMHL